MAKSAERKSHKNKSGEKRRSRSREKKWSHESKKRKPSEPESPAVKAPRTTSPPSPTPTSGSAGFTAGEPVLNAVPAGNWTAVPPMAIPLLACEPPGSDDNPFGPPPKFQQETIDLNLSLASVGGLKEQLNYLTKNVIFPMDNVSGFAAWGMEVTKGVIFHGPPGTGKTLLAKALAAELSRKKKISFYMMKGGQCFSKWIGESEKKLRQLFAEAKANQPSIIFFDELDGLCPSREGSGASHQFYTNIVTTLLGQLDEVKRGEILVIGATNRLEALDPACKRPGRFDQSLAFLPPNEDGRNEILNIKLEKWGKNKPQKNLIESLANRTVGFTGADLEQLCREAFNCALERQMPSGMNFSHFDMSCLRVTEDDWDLALSKLGRSNSNVFGNSIYSGSMPDPQIQPLIAGIVSEVKFSLEQFLPTVSQNGSTGSKIFGIKSFLVSGDSQACLDIVDTQILPAVMASFDAEKTPGFMISRETLEKTSLTTAFAQVTSCRKTCFIFLPRIDQLWGVFRRLGMQDLFTNFFDATRGSEIILVASAVGKLTSFPDQLRDLFKGMDREYEVRKPNTKERQEFFKSIFDGVISNKDCGKNEKKGRELEKLRVNAVEITKDQEIKDILNLQGELAILCREFLLNENNDLVTGIAAVLEEFRSSKLDY